MRIQYLFELEDTAGEDLVRGPRCGSLHQREPGLRRERFKLPFIHEIDRCAGSDWVAQTVWYQIFPERFANGIQPFRRRCPSLGCLYCSSNLGSLVVIFRGIIDHLDYLQELGITGLYLCPIFESPSNHKYDTIDYFEIDRHFGDKDTFRQLAE